MADIDELLHRLRVDRGYREALSSDDLRRIDRALGRQAEPSIRSLLNPPSNKGK